MSCDKSTKSESQNSEASRANWINASLNPSFARTQNQVSAYLFKPENLRELISTPDVTMVRLVISYNSDKINFSAVGVNTSGTELVTFPSVVFIDKDLDNNLLVLKNSLSTITSNNIILSSHILKSNLAYDYVQKWQKALNDGAKLNELTSFKNDRIHHFSIKKEVIQDLISIQNVSNIGLFIGVNPENKITTVLGGLNSNNKIIIPISSGNFSTRTGVIYDFALKCPDVCDFNN